MQKSSEISSTFEDFYRDSFLDNLCLYLKNSTIQILNGIRANDFSALNE